MNMATPLIRSIRKLFRSGELFTVHGSSIGRESAALSAGVAVQWNDRFSTYVYYDGQLGTRKNDTATVLMAACVSISSGYQPEPGWHIERARNRELEKHGNSGKSLPMLAFQLS